QGWGRILYRTTIPASATKRKIAINEVHDWAHVFLNGKSIGKLDRRRWDSVVEIPAVGANAQLDILIEATGRVNYGRAIIDPKGITQRVVIIDGKTRTDLKNWQVYNFPVDYAFQKKAKFKTGTINTPGWYRGTFTVDKPGDTFLDVSTWGKGMVWVNGYNIGRFWKIGPQQTLYMPGAWLKKGKNEIIVLDVDAPKEAKVAGLREPKLDELHPDESLLHRAKGQALDLTAEVPATKGSFTAGNGWKDVSFEKVQQGRYFALEALNAQQDKDPLTSIAELELTGEDGEKLSTLKWKIIYADSEEITASNSAADKVFDQQESTIWQSQSVGAKPEHPHQIVIDLGETVKIKGFRYLPRSDRSNAGMIKDYRIFIKNQVFKF
ncbi:MAG TPA: discoidin domain-containing protein, partial [Segetibacter sp.]